MCFAGASEWTGSADKIPSSLGPVRRAGFSTVTWDFHGSSHCGWTLGRCVAGESLVVWVNLTVVFDKAVYLAYCIVRVVVKIELSSPHNYKFIHTLLIARCDCWKIHLVRWISCTEVHKLLKFPNPYSFPLLGMENKILSSLWPLSPMMRKRTKMLQRRWPALWRGWHLTTTQVLHLMRRAHVLPHLLFPTSTVLTRYCKNTLYSSYNYIRKMTLRFGELWSLLFELPTGCEIACRLNSFITFKHFSWGQRLGWFMFQLMATFIMFSS